MSDATNIVDERWHRVLRDQLNNNLFLDTPKGKTAFACGVAFVLERLEGKCDEAEWRRIFDDARAFAEAYMADSIP